MGILQRASCALLAFVASASTPVQVNVDCTDTMAFPPFAWQSCGYTPAEYALRSDEFENMAWIGSAPNRAVEQVRIHFLLDLLVVTGFVVDAKKPSGYALSYDWALLDAAVDWLVANQLSPGFEFMGSPIGFPQLPESFYQPSNGNGAIEPNQTLAMTRAIARDVVLHYSARYGVSEVLAWNFESWNEPACGWNWPTGVNVTAAVFAGYTNHWDALAAGVEDAEAALLAGAGHADAPAAKLDQAGATSQASATATTAAAGGAVRFKFGGPAACQGAKSRFMQWAVQHFVNETNIYTGSPARLDYISSHFKGGGTAAGTVNGAYTLFEWIRQTYPNNPRGVWNLPFFNDEADPLVGWAAYEDWRGDARYSAMQAKEVNQHLLAASDQPVSVSNRIGLISFDAAMMNSDGYTGFSQRTLLARFNGGDGSGLPGTPFAFVRKDGLLFYSLMGKLGRTSSGTMRCNITGTGLANGGSVLSVPFGGMATLTPQLSTTASHATRDVTAASQPAQAAVMLYNSADTANATSSNDDLTVSLTLSGLPFTAGISVAAVHWRIDDSVGPEQTWAAQGSPVVPSPSQLQDLWTSARFSLLSNTNVTVGPGGVVTVPSFDLPLPALTVWHFVDLSSTAAPPVPTGLRAYMKERSLSLLDGNSQREVLVRWDCDAARGAANGSDTGINSKTATAVANGHDVAATGEASATAPFISDATLTFIVQASTNGANGPWTTVSGDPNTSGMYPDYTCAAIHAAATTQQAVWYRVQAVDYWGRASAWSDVAASGPWPAAPSDGLAEARARYGHP